MVKAARGPVDAVPAGSREGFDYAYSEQRDDPFDGIARYRHLPWQAQRTRQSGRRYLYGIQPGFYRGAGRVVATRRIGRLPVRGRHAGSLTGRWQSPAGLPPKRWFRGAVPADTIACRQAPTP